MPKLTVFTPAFNRAHTLPRTYLSLLSQTCKDFEWLIIDDGSSDGTNDLVRGWINEGIIPIRYIYQENQGMHGAHNTAYRNITTELNICIDSDDFMPSNAVSMILSKWRSDAEPTVAGIIGLDIDLSGNIIGNPLPLGCAAVKFSDYRIKGDKKIVLRSDLAKSTPEYPVFEGEKYVGLGYKYQLIDQKYSWLVLNQPLVIVDYQKDGSSYNMFRQWWNNPRGFAFIHNEDLKYVRSFKRRLMVASHYVSHCLRAKKYAAVFKSNAPLLTTLCILPGTVLFLYTWWKVRNGSLMTIGS